MGVAMLQLLSRALAFVFPTIYSMKHWNGYEGNECLTRSIGGQFANNLYLAQRCSAVCRQRLPDEPHILVVSKDVDDARPVGHGLGRARQRGVLVGKVMEPVCGDPLSRVTMKTSVQQFPTPLPPGEDVDTVRAGGYRIRSALDLGGPADAGPVTPPCLVQGEVPEPAVATACEDILLFEKKRSISVFYL